MRVVSSVQRCWRCRRCPNVCWRTTRHNSLINTHGQWSPTAHSISSISTTISNWMHLIQFPFWYGLWDGNAPWFMCWLRHYANWLFVFTYLPSSLAFFFTFFFSYAFFLPYLLPYSFTALLICLLPSRINQFRFQAGGHMRRPNLALVFLG